MDRERLAQFMGEVTRLSLRELRELQQALDREKLIRVASRRHDGASWRQIADELGVSMQAVHRKYSLDVAQLERIRRDREHRTSEEAAREAHQQWLNG